MYFNDDLTVLLSNIQSTKLSGLSVHDQIMNSHVRKHIFKEVKHSHKPQQAAVLALLYPDIERQVHMVFILRKSYNGHHSGQISFPGGKIEKKDKNLQQTALRETHEEIGVSPDKITIVKQLTPVFIPVSNYHVTPFLAVTLQTPVFIPDTHEVEQIIEVDFEQILNNPLTDIQKDYFGKTYNLKSFDINGLKIWGATAMILAEVRQLFNEVKQKSPCNKHGLLGGE